MSVLDEDIEICDKPVQLMKIQDNYILLLMRNIPKEEGFIWINKLFDYLKGLSFNGKIAFAFISKSGHITDVEKIFNSLVDGLKNIKNEPVHYYLDPVMYNLNEE